MASSFRIIDTGVREGRANIAFDVALIEERQAGHVPDTIRFLRFPPTALIGRHQDLSREVNLDYCNEHGIGIVRRITGGGAIYLDEGQLGWELVFHRSTLGIAALPELAREICSAAATGLRKLGVTAEFRPRNDIEVGGRKLSGTGGFFDGDVLIYQGTVLVDMNAQQMASVLNIPESKLAKHNLQSGADRVVTLKELLADGLPPMSEIQEALVEGFSESFGIAATPGDITEAEESLAHRYFIEEIGTDAFVEEINHPGANNTVLCGRHTGPGGTVDAYVKLEGPTRRMLQRVLLSGDFFVTPPRIVYDLEAHLMHTRVEEIDEVIDEFFANNDIDMLSVSPGDFKASIAAAVASEEASNA